MIPWFFVAFVILLVVLVWLVRRRAEEAFADLGARASAAGLPDPKVLFGKARELVARYDNPAFWEHMETVIGKDPGELARMYQAASAAETAASQ
jgi:hypothetical protein